MFSSIIKFFTLYSSIISILLGIGVLLSGHKKIKNRIFFGLLFAFSLDNAYFFLFHANLFATYPLISAICFSGIFLIGPMIFLFSQVSINPGFQFVKLSYLHLVPVLLTIMFSIPYVCIQGENFVSEKSGFFVNKIYTILGILGAISYISYLSVSGFISIKFFIKHSVDLKNEPFLIASLLIIIIFIILFLIDAIGIITDNNNFLQLVSFLLSICILLLFFVNTIFPGLRPLADNIMGKSKMRKSYLHSTNKNELKNKIEKLVNDGIYLDSELTLQKFAGLTGVTTHQFSEFINDFYKKNFTSFINDYRIKKAKELLLSEKNYTMIAVAYDSGFNSKSAFNTAFRKSENMSPGEFKRQNIS